VLVNGQGASKLTDFGIAALAGDRPLPTGTLRYMPPEQFEGAAASPAADVYAATVTFYQCVAGRVPFDGQTATELYDQHRSADVPMGPVPEALQPIIARGMAKDPRYWPSDAGRLAAELRDAATDSYGAEWEDRGRSHLAEAALLLLALHWPAGSAPAAQGTTVVHTPLTEPPAQPAPSAGQAEPVHPQPGQVQPDGSQLSPEARHSAHLRHVEHQEHLAQAERHAAHLRHLEHLAHLRREEDDDDKQPAKRRKRPHSRVRLMTAAAVAVTAAVVIGVVAAFAATGHNPPPPPSGVASPSGSAALAGAPSPGAGGIASPGITSSGTCFAAGQVDNGTAALPVTAASVAASIRQQSSTCHDTPISQITVTCGHPFTFTSNDVYPQGTISYTCDYSDLSSAATTGYYVNPATGAWRAQS
jgi:Protein kinase domain